MPRPRSRLSSRLLLRLFLGALAVCLGGVLRAAPARADNAFPNSEKIFTPESSPHEFVLGTNFGMVRSTDDGATWLWACEQANINATVYQLGPAPSYRIFAVALDSPTAMTQHLVYTNDNGCGWAASGGLLDGTSVRDEFPDPTNPNRVLALTTIPVDGGQGTDEVVESSDGGATFTTLRFTAAAGDTITGVEIASSAPQTVYLTIKAGVIAQTPILMQSTNGGVSWTKHDLSSMLAAGTKSIRLVAVDPTNPQKVLLRVSTGKDEGLALTTDGGATVTTPLALPGGILRSYARMASGTIVVGAIIVLDEVAFKSTDGGASFQQLPNPPVKLMALSSRGTALYAVADNMNDPYAVGISTDQGMSWQKFLSYDQITAIAGCLHDVCQTDCLARADMCQWPPAMCSAPAPTPDGGSAGTSGTSGTGGVGTTGAAGASGSAGSGGSAVDGGTPGGGGSSGCHCAAAPGGPGAGWLLGAATCASFAWLRGSRRRRRTRSSKS